MPRSASSDPNSSMSVDNCRIFLIGVGVAFFDDVDDDEAVDIMPRNNELFGNCGEPFKLFWLDN